MKRVGIATATRAEYGLLKPLMQRVQQDSELKLILYVTGSHLEEEYGNTYKEIENDGFSCDYKLDLGLETSSPEGIARAMGTVFDTFPAAFSESKPDLLILLGDRYEMMAIASVATIMQIPIVHLYGGESTIGAYDEAFRHSITKMSCLHFTSTEDYRRRVIQLGENPNRVFCVGALGIENIRKLALFSQEELSSQLPFPVNRRTLLITFHPETLDDQNPLVQIEELLIALRQIEDITAIFTGANADTFGVLLNRKMKEFVKSDPKRYAFFQSMGQIRYLSAMKYCGAVVGNSSSGIVEAPSFHVPTVNIGGRQKGRIQAGSIINCEPDRREIADSIQKALEGRKSGQCLEVHNPYEKSGTSENILNQLKTFLNHMDCENKNCLKKEFYDLN